jgi:hypothetical protein
LTLGVDAAYGSTMIHCRPRRRLLPLLTICGACVATQFALAGPSALPDSHGWQDLLTSKVIACGVSAVALLILSLLLRGLLKLTSLALVVVLGAGAYWFLREAMERHGELLPHDWVVFADKTLHSPNAQAAWRSIEAEFSHRFPNSRRDAGIDESRRALLAALGTREAELRKRGHKSDAEQLLRLRGLVEAGKRE